MDLTPAAQSKWMTPEAGATFWDVGMCGVHRAGRLSEDTMEERSYFSCWPWMLLGLLGLGLLGWLAAGKAPGMRNEVTAVSQTALESNGHLYGRAQVDGSVLRIAGDAPSATARDAACKAVADAIGERQMIGMPGVVSRVSCDLTVAGTAVAEAAPAAPFAPAAPAAPAAPITETNPQAASCQSRLNSAAISAPVGFAKNRAEIISGQAVLDQIASVAKECAGFAIEVGGHTDVQGPDTINTPLSQARAEAVMAYLTGKGVAATQLTARGYGASAPLDTAMTSAAHARNRRTEFKITAATAAPAAQ
jgi:outer membrane protein OmpA-like peptidoglycan-associated protein